MARGKTGFNATISGAGLGTRKVRATKLVFGLGIIASSDNEAKSRRAFYPVVTTGSSFTMTAVFVSHEEREEFNTWLSGHMVGVSEDTASSAVLTVRVPYYDFVRTCVFANDRTPGLEYGEGVTDVGYLLDLEFLGASDPVNLDLGSRMAGISYFKQPKRGASRYFYPAGVQVRGAEELDATVYDPVATGRDWVGTVDEDLDNGSRAEGGAV